MKVLNNGDVQEYWFVGMVSRCKECGYKVEFTPYDLPLQRHGWFGTYMRWQCKNPTCDVRWIHTLRKPWWRDILDTRYAEERAKHLTNVGE
jgi:hypothetical protein